MDHLQRIIRVRGLLLFRRAALDGESNDRQLRSAVQRGDLVRVVRGCYMHSAHWTDMREDERLLARTLAVAQLCSRRPPLFSHLSAAAIWGLPLYGLRPDRAERVHTLTQPEAPGRSSAVTLRHTGDHTEDDTTTVAGMRVTSLSRTVLDIARWGSPELAIGCADAALRGQLGTGRDRLPPGLEEWRNHQLHALQSLSGNPGTRRARQIIALADPRADSVAESVSRLQLARLGIPFEIQVRVTGLHGTDYWMDFEFLGQQCFGEMDGNLKYTDPALRRGRTSSKRCSTRRLAKTRCAV